MPAVKASALSTPYASTAITAAGNTGPLQPPYAAHQVVIVPSVSAFTSGTLTYEVQWSFDGTNFFSADPKDTFANITAVTPGLIKVVQAKAPYYRVAWTAATCTHLLQHAPATNSEWTPSPSPMGYVLGPQGLGAPVTGYIGATTLSAVYAPATAATYTAIMPVPAVSGAGQAGRMAIKVNTTSFTGTTPLLEVLWSFTGLPYSASTNPSPLLHADPIDQLATLTSATSVVKEFVVKAPYFALAVTSGTPTSVAFTVDVCATSL